MDVERIIDEIEQLQEMFEAPDIGHSAQVTSVLPIAGTTKCSRIALGAGFGRGMASVAALSLQSSSRLKDGLEVVTLEEGTKGYRFRRHCRSKQDFAATLSFGEKCASPPNMNISCTPTPPLHFSPSRENIS